MDPGMYVLEILSEIRESMKRFLIAVSLIPPQIIFRSISRTRHILSNRPYVLLNVT